MKLYDLANEYSDLMRMMDYDEIPQDAIADTLEAIQGEIAYKADNIACLLKNLASDITAIKSEEERLADRRKSKQAQYDYLKTYLASELLRCEIDKMETARNKISFRSSEAVAVDDENALVAHLIEIGKEAFLTMTAPKLNKTAIKDALKNGEEIDGARIVKNQNIQIK